MKMQKKTSIIRTYMQTVQGGRKRVVPELLQNSVKREEDDEKGQNCPGTALTVFLLSGCGNYWGSQ